MPRQRINAEAIPGRFPHGTKARLRKVRKPNETQASQLRQAVDLYVRQRQKLVNRVAK